MHGLRQEGKKIRTRIIARTSRREVPAERLSQTASVGDSWSQLRNILGMVLYPYRTLLFPHWSVASAKFPCCRIRSGYLGALPVPTIPQMWYDFNNQAHLQLRQTNLDVSLGRERILLA